jgi:hypothetical protein
MTLDQQLAFYQEYMQILMTDPLSLPVWLMLQRKFMLPAAMISRNDDMEKFIGHFSLNGVKNFSICRP